MSTTQPTNDNMFHSRRQFMIAAVLVVCAYFISARLGLLMPYANSLVTLIWLPTGLSVVALLRYGKWMCIPIYIAAAATNYSLGPGLLALQISLGNMLAPLACALILQRVQFNPNLSHRRDVLWLLAAATLAMTISATNGTVMLWLHGLAPHAGKVLLSWWAGDAVGVLLAAPVLLTLSIASLKKLHDRLKELLLFAMCFIVVNFYIFVSASYLQLTFVPVAILIWASMRFGAAITSIAALAASVFAAWATATGKGPFAEGGNANLIILWIYIATLTATSLIITALQTENVNAAREAKAAFKRISKVASRLPGLILQYRVSVDGTISIPYVSNAVANMFELSVDDVRKEPALLYRKIDRRDIEAGKFSLANAVPELAAWQSEFRLYRDDGTMRWIYIDALPEKEADGALLWHCFISDVTERKRADKELEIAAYTFESQDGIFVTDARWKILRLNNAFTRITGYTAEDLVGKMPPMHKHKHQDRAFYERINQSLLVKKFWQGELWAPRKNGEIYPQMITLTAITDEKGQVTNYIASFNDISRHKNYEAEIRNLAFYDPLTQLPNRRLLMDRLQHLIAKNNRLDTYSAILFIDLDNFKTINDTHGHDAGDLLLIETASRLQSCVRESDTVARLGGDEFVVVLEELSSNRDDAVQQADRIGHKIRQRLAHPYHILDIEYHSSSSIGIALFQGAETSVKDLFKRADTAMYEAKTSGRNAVRFFDPAMQAVLIVRMMLESNLRIALSNNQFDLHYQVQVNSDGKFIGAEALLRWQHPDRGFVAPSEFIPMAEETGLIVPIGLWVIEKACSQIKLWESDPRTAELIMAVNVSAKQFQQQDFVETITEIVRRHGINPMRLEIELTESTILDNVDATTEKMKELKKLGIAFSMDDFGTGYSSLAYLQRLPLNQLKIDQSFVRDLSHDENDATIVRAIISLGINLGLNVIAEGVETDAQRSFLITHNCHAFQGYLFSKPLSSLDFKNFITTHQSTEDPAAFLLI